MSYTSVWVPTSEDPYTPPKYVLREMYYLDPFLRLCWSPRKQQWGVYRKILHRMEYIHSLPQYVKREDGVWVENESWRTAREGWIIIGYWPPQPRLSDWCLRALRFYDIRRFRGGWKEVELELIRQEERERERKKRRQDNQIEEIARDEWETWCWQFGERVAVPNTYFGQPPFQKKDSSTNNPSSPSSP